MTEPKTEPVEIWGVAMSRQLVKLAKILAITALLITVAVTLASYGITDNLSSALRWGAIAGGICGVLGALALFGGWLTEIGY